MNRWNLLARAHQLRCAGLAVVVLLVVGVAAAQGADNVLVKGSVFGPLNGAYFDAGNRLHVASVMSSGVFVFDRETGAVLDFIGSDRGVTFPDDLTFGPDGSMYWTSILTGEVGRRTPGGEVTTQLVAPGVNAITFNGDGRLFVACDFFGDGLYEVDPELVDPPERLIETLGFLNAFDFGPDGMLYGPIWTQGRVVKIDVDADPPTVETVTTEVEIPSAVKFDSQGRLHVLDYSTGAVRRVNTTSGSTELLAMLPPGLDNLAFDSADRLFVTSNTDGFVVEVLAGGELRWLLPAGIGLPQGVAVLPRNGGESVFVSGNYTLREYDGTTGGRLSVTNNTLMPGDVLNANTVAPHGDDLVLSSWFGNEVQVWDPTAGAVVEEYHDFILPTNAISFQDDLVVASAGEGGAAPEVVWLRDGGEVVLVAPGSGVYLPVGLAASDKDLWVGDWATGIIWQVVADGEPMATPKMVAGGLSGPEGMAVDLDGSLLVVEAGAHRLSRVVPGSGAVIPLVEGLALGVPGAPGFLPSLYFSGVAVGPSGAIYVTGDAGHVVYKLTTSTHYVPTAAHLGGLLGTVWRSDLEVHNRGAQQVGFTVELLKHGHDNSSPEAVAFSLAPGVSARYVDVLDGLFQYEGSAGLRVTATGGDLVVASTTYNDAPTGRYGQYIPALTLDDAIVQGQEAHLVLLSHSADSSKGNRTNIGLASACGQPITVEINLHAADGSLLGTMTAELKPFELQQINKPLAGMTTADVPVAYAVVSSATPGARYFAYAAVVGNQTGDSIFVVAQ